ncbi:alpha-amylase 4N-like [Lutzomyia longipalpis]|uniref:alpha-amylase 4N-like n=1 Tax=Lutzomyia longipalpis TaxID=7200 RepID=UPI0024842759|nr:alpha-amylase 4N-like [Lutzomyia longipalpis]
MKFLIGFGVVLLLVAVAAQYDPHYLDKRTVMVHLFEWKWNDIAKECQDYLGPNGFGGVQVSPVNENWVSGERAWFERYQPISYKLTTRSGNEDEFAAMVKTCRQNGVRIFVDVVVNHMASGALEDTIYGTGGSEAHPGPFDYPAVPYEKNDFHPDCSISDYQDVYQVRNCQLSSLRDLNQTIPYVREKILDFLNHLVDLGVAGFRIDAAKHMDPKDLRYIYNHIKKLNKDAEFKAGDKAFIFQEVIDLGGEAVSSREYISLGVVTEFKASDDLGKLFRGQVALSTLERWGPQYGLLPSNRALAFVENHDNERGHGAGGTNILTYKDGKIYTMAVVFNLAHSYGVPRMMSSYEFNDPSQGPPHDDNSNILTPEFSADGNSCTNGWVCQHRWRPMRNMVKFRNIVGRKSVRKWYDNGSNQIAFSRGNQGFVAFNLDIVDFNQQVPTDLPDGVYCDVITGEKNGNECTGKVVIVSKRKAAVILRADDDYGVLAIHSESKL